MASLINRLWSQADFWDKKENKKQQQQMARPQAVQPPRPSNVQQQIKTQAPRIGAQPVIPRINFGPDNKPGFQLGNNSLTRGISRTIDQINPLDSGRTWKQRTPTVPEMSAWEQTKNHGIVKGFTESPTQLGRGFGYGFGKDIREAQNAQQSALESNAQLLKNAGQRLRDPRISNAERQRWANFIGKQRVNMADLSQDAVNLSETQLNETDPIRMGAATADLGLTIGLAPVNVAGGAAAKTAFQGAKQAAVKTGTKFATARGVAAGAGSLAKAGLVSGSMAAPSGALSTYIQNPEATAQEMAKNAAVAGAMGFVSPAAFAGLGALGKGVVKGVKGVDKYAQNATKRAAVNKFSAESIKQADNIRFEAHNRIRIADQKGLPQNHPLRKQAQQLFKEADAVQMRIMPVKLTRTQKIFDPLFTKQPGLSTGGPVNREYQKLKNTVDPTAALKQDAKDIKIRTLKTADGKTEYVAQLGNKVTDRAGRETGFNANTTSPNFKSEGEMNKWIKAQTDATAPQPTVAPVQKPSTQIKRTTTGRGDDLISIGKQKYESLSLPDGFNVYKNTRTGEIVSRSDIESQFGVLPKQQLVKSTTQKPVSNAAIPAPVKPSAQIQTKAEPKTAQGIQQTASSPQTVSQPTSKTGRQIAQQLRAAEAQGTATPEVKTNRPLSDNNTTTIKVTQRGGAKQVTVGRVTIPDDLVGDVNAWKDVGSTFKSQDRIIEAAAPTDAQYKKIWEWAIKPRGEAVTAMVDETKVIKGELKKVVDAYGLKNKEVRADVMRYGEKKISYDDLVAKHGQKQADNIVEADKWFRSQYDRLLDETNATLRKFKQPEIPRRDNYYTHFQDDNVWARAGLKLRQLAQSGDVMQEVSPQGMRTQKIDPKLLGQSEFTKPNKKYNPFAQRRTGDKTKYDAVEAFERYLIPTLHNKHLTESVVKTRMLTKQFQEATAESKNLPNFIRSLQEYGNSLSGKTNRFDRPFLETKWGNRAMNTTRYMQQQMGRNTILGSVRSAVMQTAALPLSIKEAGMANTTLGLVDEIVGKVAGKDAAALSPFLRRRYADMDSVLPSKLRKAENAAAFAFEQIEQTSSKAIWRANHRKAISSGLSGKKAVDEADRITERILGGRAIGERAEAFRSVIGNTGLQFQLEVNNFMQEVMRDAGQKNVKKLLKLFAATYAFNSLVYEPLLGDRPLPDPVDAAIETFNLAKEGNIAGAVGRMPAEVLSNVPGGSLIAGLYPQYGMEVAGMKLPTREKLFGDTEAGRYGGSLAALGAIKNPEYLIPKSFGLKQVDRTIGAIQDLAKGEKQDKNGKSLFSIDANPLNVARGVLFGTYGTNEGKAYLDEKAKNKQGIKTTDGKSSTADEKETVNDRIKIAMTSPEAKAMLELKTDKEKQAQYPDLYKQYKAMQKGLSDTSIGNDRPKNYDALPDAAKGFYDQQARLTDSGKEKWLKRPTSGRTAKAYENMNTWRPDQKDYPDLPNTNKVASIYAKFESDKQAGNWNATRENIEKKKALREAYGTALDDNDKWLLKASTAQTKEAIANGDLTKEKLAELVAFDDLMIDLGGSAQISKEIRRAYGYGGGGSSRKGSSRSKSGGTGSKWSKSAAELKAQLSQNAAKTTDFGRARLSNSAYPAPTKATINKYTVARKSGRSFTVKKGEKYS